MAEKDSWVWEHFKKEGNKIRCKTCNVGYTLFTSNITNMHKAHLYAHGISNKEADEEWKNEQVKSDSVWQFFTRGKPYTATCNICKSVLQHAYFEEILIKHYKFHNQIHSTISEVKTSWLSKYFKLPIKNGRIYCNRCEKTINVFNNLESHLFRFHGIFESDEIKESAESTESTESAESTENAEGAESLKNIKSTKI